MHSGVAAKRAEQRRFSKLAAILPLLFVQSRPTAAHKGWITAIERWQGEYYSCSQAGIFVGVKDSLRPFAKTPWRITSIAGLQQAQVRAKAKAFLLLGGGQPARSGHIAVLDAKGKSIVEKQVGKDLVYCVAASKDGKLGAAAMADGRVMLFELPGLEKLREIYRHTAIVRRVVFSDNGQYLASAGLDNLVHLTEVREGKLSARLLEGHSAGIEALCFSKDGNSVLSGSLDGKVRMHDCRSGRLKRSWYGLGSKILSLSCAKDRIYVGLASGALYCLDRASEDRHRILAPDAERPVFVLIDGPLGDGTQRSMLLASKSLKSLRLTACSHSVAINHK